MKVVADAFILKKNYQFEDEEYKLEVYGDYIDPIEDQFIRLESRGGIP